jgi:transposase
VPSWNLRVCHRGGNDDALIAATRSFEIEKIFTAIPVLKTNGFSYAKPNRKYTHDVRLRTWIDRWLARISHTGSDLRAAAAPRAAERVRELQQ